MNEAAAVEIPGNAVASTFAEYGLIGLVVFGLLFILYKLILSYIKKVESDGESMRGIAQSQYELAEAIRRNSEAAERVVDAVRQLAITLGSLPCTPRDPHARTRETDHKEVMSQLGVHL